MKVTLIQNSMSCNNSEEFSSLPFCFNYGILKSKIVRALGMSAFETPALALCRTCTTLPFCLLSVNLYANCDEENCK